MTDNTDDDVVLDMLEIIRDLDLTKYRVKLVWDSETNQDVGYWVGLRCVQPPQVDNLEFEDLTRQELVSRLGGRGVEELMVTRPMLVESGSEDVDDATTTTFTISDESVNTTSELSVQEDPSKNENIVENPFFSPPRKSPSQTAVKCPVRSSFPPPGQTSYPPKVECEEAGCGKTLVYKKYLRHMKLVHGVKKQDLPVGRCPHCSCNICSLTLKYHIKFIHNKEVSLTNAKNSDEADETENINNCLQYNLSQAQTEPSSSRAVTGVQVDQTKEAEENFPRKNSYLIEMGDLAPKSGKMAQYTVPFDINITSTTLSVTDSSCDENDRMMPKNKKNPDRNHRIDKNDNLNWDAKDDVLPPNKADVKRVDSLSKKSLTTQRSSEGSNLVSTSKVNPEINKQLFPSGIYCKNEVGSPLIKNEEEGEGVLLNDKTVNKYSNEESARNRSTLAPAVEVNFDKSASKNAKLVGGSVLLSESSLDISSSSSSSCSCSSCSSSSDSSSDSSIYSDSDCDVTNDIKKDSNQTKSDFTNCFTFNDFSMADFPTYLSEAKKQRVTKICGFQGCERRVHYRRITLHLQTFHGIDVEDLPTFKCPMRLCGRRPMMELSKEFHMKVYHPKEVAKKREETTPVGFKCQVVIYNSYEVQALIDTELSHVRRSYRVENTDLRKSARKRQMKTKQTMEDSENSTDEVKPDKCSKLTEEQEAILRDVSEACPNPSLAIRRKAATELGVPSRVIHGWFYRRKNKNTKTKAPEENGSRNLKYSQPLTAEGKKVLESLYKRSPFPSSRIRVRTARKLGLSKEVVNEWFYRRKNQGGTRGPGSGTSTKPVLERKASKESPGLLLPNTAYNMTRVKQKLTLEDLICSEDESDDEDFKLPKSC